MNEVTARTSFYAWYTELSFRCVFRRLLQEPVIHKPRSGHVLPFSHGQLSPVKIWQVLWSLQMKWTLDWKFSLRRLQYLNICFQQKNLHKVTDICCSKTTAVHLSSRDRSHSLSYRKGFNSSVTRLRKQWVKRKKRPENWVISRDH